MQTLHHRVILLAATEMRLQGLATLLEMSGSKEFELEQASGAEQLVEIAGRLCYKSWEPGLNKNVTKVREGNAHYISNILKSKHGSVLEHATTSLAFMNVSRVFTHEVVRHRAGTAFSQESMRYVRLDNIGMYYPDAFGEDFLHDVAIALDVANPTTWVVSAAHEIKQRFGTAVRAVETAMADILTVLHIDELTNFHLKKTITSALRRIAPSGHLTNIIVTANHRAWRHMIEQRTHPSAEEEIRLVFSDVAQLMVNSFPNIYQDMVAGKDGEITFINSKI